LVVIAHPLHDSLCRTLAQTAVDTLESAGHQVQVEDLYATAFAPVLTEAERRSYYAPRFDAAQVQAQLRRLQAAEVLVLVFPTWWFGFPGILKGWFDRVWAPGHVYPCQRSGRYPAPSARAAACGGHHHLGLTLVGGPPGDVASRAPRFENRLAGHLRTTL
jgi:putative NADPH-quinone reductase